MEYYYIDFKTMDICSWFDGSDNGEYQIELDKAYKLTGNYFKSFNDAENTILSILKKVGSPSIKSKIR